MGNYPTSFVSRVVHERAVEIGQQSLPTNHPRLRINMEKKPRRCEKIIICNFLFLKERTQTFFMKRKEIIDARAYRKPCSCS